MGHAQLQQKRLTLEPCSAYPVVRCLARLCWLQQQAQQHPLLAHAHAPGAALPSRTDAVPLLKQLPLSKLEMAALLAAALTCSQKALHQLDHYQEHCLGFVVP